VTISNPANVTFTSVASRSVGASSIFRASVGSRTLIDIVTSGETITNETIVTRTRYTREDGNTSCVGSATILRSSGMFAVILRGTDSTITIGIGEASVASTLVTAYSVGASSVFRALVGS
jgi:hypothetical protein